ncbi:MAG: chemotaxis protein CheX [Planctomycetota bacterium]|jgi:hypothetical protein
MTSLLEQTLCYVAEEQFESLAFMFPVPEDPDTPETVAEEWTTVRVGFAGPFGGQLHLAVPSRMLPILGANMLGMDDGAPSPDQQVDALKEMINVVCGNLLPTIAGAEAVFNVEAPELVGAGPSPQVPLEPPPAAATRVILDEGAAELCLFVDGRVPDVELPAEEDRAWFAGSPARQG